MAMKFDKEMLLKHRFWIMLGVAVTLTPCSAGAAGSSPRTSA